MTEIERHVEFFEQEDGATWFRQTIPATKMVCFVYVKVNYVAVRLKGFPEWSVIPSAADNDDDPQYPIGPFYTLKKAIDYIKVRAALEQSNGN